MNLVIISHKETWVDQNSISGFSTTGGFPFQIEAISQLFTRTTVLVPVRDTPFPSGTRALSGKNVFIEPLSEPQGTNLARKLSLLYWFPVSLPRIWKTIKQSDVVHAAVPGDVGSLGILVALAQHKPLFVRHCGTWGEPVTLADHLLLCLLERIASPKTIVLATGGAETPPSSRNSYVQWIFSTTLSQQELAAMPAASPWQPGQPPRLAFVGRLSRDKNAAAVIDAMPFIQQQYPGVTLDIVGDGEMLADLRQRASAAGVQQQVTFHGSVAHEAVMRILSHSHLFVFPTRVKEGFPKAVLEAMACGLPVIATPVSVIPHLIGDHSGRLLPDTDAASVARAVLDLLADPGRLAAMSARARQAAMGYTLEAWRDEIGARLQAAWGPLKQGNSTGSISDG